MSSNTTTVEKASAWENGAASAAMGILSATGLLAYGTVVVAMARHFLKFKKNPFYAFVLSLAISDSTMLCLFLFYSVPSTLLQSRPFGDGVDALLGAVCNLAYFAGLACIQNIAVNRYVGVCRYNLYVSVYRPRRLRLALVLIWLVGLVSAVPQLTECCRVRYYFADYTWGYDLDLAGNGYYIWYDRLQNVLTFGLIVWSFAMIRGAQKGAAAAKAALSRRSAAARRRRTELRLAGQFLAVAVVLLVFGLGFTIIPELSTYRWHLFVTSLLYILNNGINPFIYLAFNEAIQESVGLRTPHTGAPTRLFDRKAVEPMQAQAHLPSASQPPPPEEVPPFSGNSTKKSKSVVLVEINHVDSYPNQLPEVIQSS